ncbi:MAG: ribonuclease P protein component [Patescibacteria group bacterium]
MLPIANRLKKNKEIKQVFEGGTRFQQGLLIIKTIHNTLEQSRFAFIASQRLSKKAVVRNRVKRRLREIVSLNLKDMSGGRDVVIIASIGFDHQDFNQSKEDLEKLFLKAGLTEK